MRRAPHQRLVAVGAAVALGGAALVAASPSSALYGEAVIEPIESDIAEKYWATAEDGHGSPSAALAVDGDESTSWTAPTQRPGEALTVDLGGAYDNLRKVEVVLAEAARGMHYVVEVSGDGQTWDVVADHRSARTGAAGTVELFTRADTRYVRVRATAASPRARFGVAEVSVYNYLREDVLLGADLSWADQDRDRVHAVDAAALRAGEPDAGPHVLDVVQDRGMEYIRLRVWNEPRSEFSGAPSATPFQGPERSLVVAKEIADRGLGLGIDFHYADSWADPSKQPKPRAWAELPFDELEQAVYDFTADYLDQLRAQGTVPDKVAVGNEVINGFMYGSEAAIIGTTNPAYFRNQADVYQSQPGGGLLWDYWQSEDPAEQQAYDEAWDRFATLMASGIRAVRDASPESKVEIHAIVDQDKLDTALEFWDQTLTRLDEKGVDIDIIALSYYPQYHGTPTDLVRNLHEIAVRHPGYEIDITETSYPASGAGGAPMPNSTFPRTVQGQADAIQWVIQSVNDVVDNRGGGVLIWEPSRWQSMFTDVTIDGVTIREANASMDVFNKSVARHVLQDRVFVVTGQQATPDLPATVDVLHTADDRREQVTVDWESVPATTSLGTFDVVGSTEYGPVTATVHVVEEGRGRS